MAIYCHFLDESKNYASKLLRCFSYGDVRCARTGREVTTRGMTAHLKTRLFKMFKIGYFLLKIVVNRKINLRSCESTDL